MTKEDQQLMKYTLAIQYYSVLFMQPLGTSLLQSKMRLKNSSQVMILIYIFKEDSTSIYFIGSSPNHCKGD